MGWGESQVSELGENAVQKGCKGVGSQCTGEHDQLAVADSPFSHPEVIKNGLHRRTQERPRNGREKPIRLMCKTPRHHFSQSLAALASLKWLHRLHVHLLVVLY